jgi:hypothetical protein
VILLSGFLFYSGCCLAALAMVATYIIGLYGAAATAVYAGAGMVRVGGGQVVRMCAPRVRVLTQILCCVLNPPATARIYLQRLGVFFNGGDRLLNTPVILMKAPRDRPSRGLRVVGQHGQSH